MIQESTVVSADISGMIRVWDVRTFTTVQSFNVPLNEVHSLEVILNPKTIVVGGKRLVFYDYDEPTDTKLTDDEGCLEILYNKVFFTFITAHPKSVKVWDAETGRLQNVFRDLTNREITSIQLDKRQRKLFVGDSKGRVFSINVKNGALMKKFARHQSVTSSLVYCGETTRLMSCGWDKAVMVHDDRQSESQSESRSKFTQHTDQVNYLAYNEKMKLLASCSDDKNVLLFNLQTYRQEAVLKDHKAEVKVVAFLGNAGCIVAADMIGDMYFWTVEPCERKHVLIEIIPNNILTDTQKEIKFPIKSLSYDEKNMILYSGDDMGNLHMWNVSELIEVVRNLKKISYLSKESIPTFMTETKETALRQGNYVSQIKRIKGHEEGVTSICYVPVPQCVASCSYDCKAYIWSPMLEKLGALLIGHDPDWKLIISKEERMKAQREKAVKLLEILPSEKYKLFAKTTGFQTKEELRDYEILRKPKEEEEKRRKELIAGDRNLELQSEFDSKKREEEEFKLENPLKPNLKKAVYQSKRNDSDKKDDFSLKIPSKR